MSEASRTRAGGSWSLTWKWVLALTVCGVLGWIAFVRGERVPLLAEADLGFHELGHLLGAVLPNVLTVLAGSGLQMLVPLGLACYFHLARKDLLAVSLMLAWAGTSFQNVSVYVADAPYRDLPIIGGPGAHDWAYLLGPAQFDAMDSAATIARTVWVLGLLLLVAGVLVCVAGFLRPRLVPGRRRRRDERLASLPVREPRTRLPSGGMGGGTPLAPLADDDADRGGA